MTLTEQLQSILDNLRSAVPELRGVMVASTDGLSIASSVSQGDPARMAAMVATAYGLGRRICDSFGSGAFAETSFFGASGQVFVFAAGTKGVLALVAPQGGNVGLINLEARDAAAKVAQILG